MIDKYIKADVADMNGKCKTDKYINCWRGRGRDRDDKLSKLIAV